MNGHLLTDPAALRKTIQERLFQYCGCESLHRNEPCDDVRTSSVMLLLGRSVPRDGRKPEICIILNKRSRDVRQGGDLCCPGGSMESRFDPWLAKLLTLPGSPLSRWPNWKVLRHCKAGDADLLALLLATSIRESWEEMRLNPFKIRFLGPLPSQCLLLFRRVIHPMVCWVSGRKRFTPSWEVEKIVDLPLRHLLDPAHYVRYRLHVPEHLAWRFKGTTTDFPGLIFRDNGGTEVLWGVTYRIVTLLLELVFGFIPPGMERLPVVPSVLDEQYVYGKSGTPPRAPLVPGGTHRPCGCGEDDPDAVAVTGSRMGRR